MGINTYAHLPQDTDLYMLKDAIEKLLPNATVKMENGWSLGAISLEISTDDGTTNKPTMPDGETHHSANIFLQGGERNDKLSIYCGSSTTFWTAFCVRLAQIFGGTVDINDCDSSDEDFKFERQVPKYRSSGLVTARDEMLDRRLRKLIERQRPLDLHDLLKVNRAVREAGAYTLEDCQAAREKAAV